jgi:hypothetical protein
MVNRVPSYQTVKLQRGKHSSPREGACVMELASMLAGERFSDRPFCVSPAIAGFLRAYNDFVDDHRRQDLFGLAAFVVGTRATPEIERLRVRRVVEWGRALRNERRFGALQRAFERFRIGDDGFTADEAAAFAIRSIPRKASRVHAQAMDLVDELVALGHEDREGEGSREAASPRQDSVLALETRRGQAHSPYQGE